MSFAIHRRPGGVAFLDDDRDYLEMLAEVMPLDWHVRLYLRPVACIGMLLEEPTRWEEDAWRQQEIINRWREGTPLIGQILAYWRNDGMARFSLTRVCVVDYSMPAMSGLRVLSELAPWTGSRILLTGRADEQLAVSAFNRGLIEQFIPKQSPDIRLRLTGMIESLFAQPDPRHEQTWRATLSREQNALLCNADISREMQALALREGWCEHVAIGAPFGVLALDRKGGVRWLQLEPAANLQELAELAQSQGWDEATVRDVAAGHRLIDLELALQLPAGNQHKPAPRTAFRMGSGDDVLYAAFFDIAAEESPGAQGSYERFIALAGERTLQD